MLNAGVQLKARDREENMEEQYAALATLRQDNIAQKTTTLKHRRFSGAFLPRKEKGELQCLSEVRWLGGSWLLGRRVVLPA